jgi:uncharacterized protein YgbK (DUF1537 family)
VFLQWPREPPACIGVAALDLDVREQPAEETYARARTAARSVARWGNGQLFAKIDSTLRGELGAFIRGVLDGSGLRRSLVAPAFPEQGRLLVGGRLRLAAHAVDPEAPSLPDRLAASGLRAAGVSLALACLDSERLQLEVQRLLDSGADAIVVDADTPACLQRTAELWWRESESLLLAGSAGIARRVAVLAGRPEWPRTGHAERSEASPGGARSGKPTISVAERQILRYAKDDTTNRVAQDDRTKVLVVVGTPAADTLGQLEALERLPAVTTLQIGPRSPLPALVPTLDEAVLVLRATPLEHAGNSLRDRGEHAAAVADACARLAQTYRPGGIVLTGGATARLVCERLGVQAVRVTGELSPGVPHGVLAGGVWDGLPVITKAGGFGGPTLLLDAIHWLGVSWEQAS